MCMESFLPSLAFSFLVFFSFFFFIGGESFGEPVKEKEPGEGERIEHA